ncbi:MAG TPA: hypothetical protein VMU69_24450 [Bradyrhizobium sp.]|nr:hypothetical protein [Bradyrhizobium sp.]
MIVMLKIGPVQVVALPLLLMTTPTIADVVNDLTHCQLEAERLFPFPPAKAPQNWSDRAVNLQKQAERVETCMRAAGYTVTAECSMPLKTYEGCLKIADQIMHSPAENQYRNADWNKICLDNEWDVRTQKRLSADCYQSGNWWRGWLGH